MSLTSTGNLNFVFTDSHAKFMKPEATDPDPVNQAAKNLWDGTR